MNQFDFTPGFDLTSVVSATQSQIQQAIAQIAPLSNVGIVLYGAVAPDVVNNARFSRYVWIDTSGGAPYVLKTYNGAAWVASTVGAGSISAAAQIVDGIITLAKLSVAGGGAGKLIRVNAGNTAFEFINFSDLLSAGSIPFTAIETTGSAANYFLKRNNANTAYALEPFSASFIPVNTLGFSQLQNGAAAVNIIKSSGALNAWQEIEHKLANMTATGGTAYQVARVNSTATAPEWATPQNIQAVHTEVTAASSVVTVLPHDNTTPTNAEGDVIAAFETTITPRFAASFLLVEITLNVSGNASLHVTASVWRDPATGAVTSGTPIAAASQAIPAADNSHILKITVRVPATSLAQTFFKLRIGPDGNTAYLNRISSTPLLGGVAISSMRVTEVIA